MAIKFFTGDMSMTKTCFYDTYSTFKDVRFSKFSDSK